MLLFLTKKKNVTLNNIDLVPPQNLPWKLGVTLFYNRTSSLALLQKPKFPMCTKTVFCVDEHLLCDPDLDFEITRAYIEPMPLPNPVRGKGYLPSDQSTKQTAVTIIPGASLKRWMIVHTWQ